MSGGRPPAVARFCIRLEFPGAEFPYRRDVRGSCPGPAGRVGVGGSKHRIFAIRHARFASLRGLSPGRLKIGAQDCPENSGFSTFRMFGTERCSASPAAAAFSSSATGLDHRSENVGVDLGSISMAADVDQIPYSADFGEMRRLGGLPENQPAVHIRESPRQRGSLGPCPFQDRPVIHRGGKISPRSLGC